MQSSLRYIDSQKAELFVTQVLVRNGLSESDARSVANGLVETSLRGVDTHGLRLLPLYVKELEGGRSNARPQFRFEATRASVVKMDADAALGIMAGFAGADKAVEVARKSGVGVVSVANSNHFGAAALYGLRIARQGFIGIALTHAAARVAPFGGRTQLFGTDPICFTAPRKDGHPFCLDMATSQISYSKVKHHRLRGETLEPGWAVDDHGEPTVEPDSVSALSPVGGYKGQGLSMMVQVLCALLADMPLDWELSHLDSGGFSEPRKISHFFMAIDFSAFTNVERFLSQMGILVDTVRDSAARAGGAVAVAGDIEERRKEERLRTGIPLSAAEFDSLLAVARKLEIEGMASAMLVK
ncbi:Ldh family oxidoreductase [Haliangium ochraceum]|uniref:Malate/L-lactate dehydrogenase n=1 Tax=Haliangium ochraceum (strain DSM 14365 / JCM 11303 / SMP-2) TaxID=502025 RepID=D0LLD6_HALO1|nr:Ldh family oxidoreductase [Haliangium ochraceum]ACY18632.1 Malate/L-lactate dehydrogenase [Haliangium ochraceum DSM 14365]